jgi:hypothetical protein
MAAKTRENRQVPFWGFLRMRALTKVSLAVAALIISFAVAPAAKADPITIQSGGFSLPDLGNDGTGINGLDLLVGAASSTTRNINGHGSFIALLNPLEFTTGFTGANSGGGHLFDFSQLLTINGMTQTLNLSGSIDISHLVDTVHIFESAPLVFNFNTFTVTVTVLPTDIAGWGPGTFCGNLKAKIVVNDCKPVPEPATLTLLGLGLAGAAAKFRKKRKAKSA